MKVFRKWAKPDGMPAPPMIVALNLTLDEAGKFTGEAPEKLMRAKKPGKRLRKKKKKKKGVLPIASMQSNSEYLNLQSRTINITNKLCAAGGAGVKEQQFHQGAFRLLLQ